MCFETGQGFGPGDSTIRPGKLFARCNHAQKVSRQLPVSMEMSK